MDKAFRPRINGPGEWTCYRAPCHMGHVAIGQDRNLPYLDTSGDAYGAVESQPPISEEHCELIGLSMVL